MNFEINSIFINGESQVCSKNNQQIWPQQSQTTSEETTMIDTTTNIYPSSSSADSTNEESPSLDSCGIQPVNQFSENSFLFPSIPGQFPWVVAIYRYNDDEESYYKCSGTIIDKRTILTSANCLLEDGLLLQTSDFIVHVSHYNLQSKPQKSRSFEVDEVIPHESFNMHLDNNIALLKLTNSEYTVYLEFSCLHS